MSTDSTLAIESIRPLIRYVDEDQAVIDTHLRIRPKVPTRSTPPAPQVINLFVEVDSEDGFHDEQEFSIALSDLHCAFRIEMVQPRRWWPAGLGEQPLYTLSVSLIMRDQVVDRLSRPVGLTSVRCKPDSIELRHLKVNGREYTVGSIVAIDKVDESGLLAVGGETLLIVRDHYGPEVLYEAADRAGILLVQCVPIDPAASPEESIGAQVARLASHPSLVGWCVGHHGAMTSSMAARLRELDPTHSVFDHVPEDWAA